MTTDWKRRSRSNKRSRKNAKAKFRQENKKLEEEKPRGKCKHCGAPAKFLDEFHFPGEHVIYYQCLGACEREISRYVV